MWLPPLKAPAELPPRVLARWQSSTVDSAPTTVLPDGCCDLILHIDADGRSNWHLSALADAAMRVPGSPGEHWLGYRLQPGTAVDAPALLRHAQALWPAHPQTKDAGALEALVLEAIDRHTRIDARVEDALQALAHAPTVAAAARQLGVSDRSLERLTRRTTGRPPRFWRALARVRRAAQGLSTPQPLADLAADHGFSDQAHFSRECLRWLGQTPGALRSDPAVLATVAQVGYG